MFIDLILKYVNFKKMFLIIIFILYKNGFFLLGEGGLSFGICV